VTDRMYLVTGDPPAAWDSVSRVEFFRETFRGDIVEGGDELAMFARLVCVLGEPARLLGELRVGMSERSEDALRSHAAVALEYAAAACLVIAEELREPRT
jgi:hypothetical protein